MQAWLLFMEKREVL